MVADGRTSALRLAHQPPRDARPRAALPFANRAVDLAPWDTGTIDTLATTANDVSTILAKRTHPEASTIRVPKRQRRRGPWGDRWRAC